MAFFRKKQTDAAAFLRAHHKNDPFTHIFIDIETLGVKRTAPILSIGAVAFNTAGEEIGAGSWLVEPANAHMFGIEEAATVAWWEKQTDQAKYIAFHEGPRITLPEALEGMAGFFAQYTGRRCIWANSPSFDCAILRHAFEAVGMPEPWTYWEERDVRTMAWLGDRVGSIAPDFEGRPHVAIDDARHQGRQVMGIIREVLE